MKLLAILLALGTSAASADTVIYDTFNEQDPAHLFDCCNALHVTTRHAEEGVRRYAIPFTAPADAHIHEVDLAVGSEIPNRVVLAVAIRDDVNGLPGEAIEHWAADPPPSGQCCLFLDLHTPKPGAKIHAGVTYWLEVKALYKRSTGDWNLNSMGVTGDYATYDGTWQLTSGPLPAARIITKR